MNVDVAKASSIIPPWAVRVIIGRNPAWTLARIAILILAVWVTFSYVITPPIRVTGISMQPTFFDGQINFLNRLAYLRRPPERGDIVGIGGFNTSGHTTMLLKRIVALPGETIEFRFGKLYVDGKRIEEPYVKTRCDWGMAPERLAADEYYVVGDNREMAQRDHVQGRAQRKQIVGKVVFGGRT